LLSYLSPTIGDLNYVTNDTRDDVGISHNDLDSYFDKSDEERATDISDTTDGSDDLKAGMRQTSSLLTMPIILIYRNGSRM
jgi:hypothetical protein